MTLDEIRLEILRICFHPGKSPDVNVSDAKVYEAYVLGEKDKATPGNELKPSPKTK